jgi:hypothetical protein
MTRPDSQGAEAMLGEYRLRAILCTGGLFVTALVVEVVLAALLGVRYAAVGTAVGAVAWGLYGAWRIRTARPEPVKRRSKGLSGVAWVAIFAFIALGNSNPTLGVGLPAAAIFALGLAQPVTVILARRRLRAEPELVVNNTITANAMYRTAFTPESAS